MRSACLEGIEQVGVRAGARDGLDEVRDLAVERRERATVPIGVVGDRVRREFREQALHDRRDHRRAQYVTAEREQHGVFEHRDRFLQRVAARGHAALVIGDAPVRLAMEHALGESTPGAVF